VQQKGYASCSGCHGNNGTNASRPCILCHNSNDLPYDSKQKGDKSHNFSDSKQEPTASSALTDENCLICHEASNMNGIFELNRDLSSFQQQKGQTVVYKHSNDFCLSCHNRDDQISGFEMSTQNYRDPLIAMQDNYHFIDKHGAEKGSGQRSYSGLRDHYSYPVIVACTDCHAMHGTHNDKLIIANAYNGATRLSRLIKDQNISINTDNGEYAQLCVTCHAMDNIIEQGDIDTGNGLSGVHQANGSCLDCHRHGMAVQTGL